MAAGLFMTSHVSTIDEVVVDVVVALTSVLFRSGVLVLVVVGSSSTCTMIAHDKIPLQLHTGLGAIEGLVMLTGHELSSGNKNLGGRVSLTRSPARPTVLKAILTCTSATNPVLGCSDPRRSTSKYNNPLDSIGSVTEMWSPTPPPTIVEDNSKVSEDGNCGVNTSASRVYNNPAMRPLDALKAMSSTPLLALHLDSICTKL
mmetsp:Transcript_66598/g.156762  ORF Transcript_66598/g.156762 Transcript_66598/m.156762 type:complete len:202 (+) Transcript_66598:2452-3057(+)